MQLKVSPSYLSKLASLPNFHCPYPSPSHWCWRVHEEETAAAAMCNIVNEFNSMKSSWPASLQACWAGWGTAIPLFNWGCCSKRSIGGTTAIKCSLPVNFDNSILETFIIQFPSKLWAFSSGNWIFCAYGPMHMVRWPYGQIWPIWPFMAIWPSDHMRQIWASGVSLERAIKM